MAWWCGDLSPWAQLDRAQHKHTHTHTHARNSKSQTVSSICIMAKRLNQPVSLPSRGHYSNIVRRQIPFVSKSKISVTHESFRVDIFLCLLYSSDQFPVCLLVLFKFRQDDLIIAVRFYCCGIDAPTQDPSESSFTWLIQTECQ